MAQHELTKSKVAPREIQQLQKEVDVLRSLLISLVGEDEEGKYRPEVVQRLLRATHEDANMRFKNGRSFLRDLANTK